MIVKCKDCGTTRQASIFDDRECCGVGGFCYITHYTFDEFISIYQEIKKHLTINRDEKIFFKNAKFIIPLNGLYGDAEGFNDDLASQILLNEFVCLDSNQFTDESTDEYLKKLTSENLLTFVNFN
jgi:hypothetical protein